MKLKFFSVMFLLLSFAIFSQEATVDELFTKGNQAYISGKYLEAKENYQKLLNNFNLDNYAVNYNLGCCYYKLHQLGYARFYLEKAFLFQPQNEDLKNSMNVLLDEIGKKNGYTEEDEFSIKRMLLFVSPLVVFIIFCIFFILLIFFIFMFLKKSSRIYFTLSIGAFICTIFLFSFAFVQYNTINDNCGIVVKDADVYLSADNSTPISSVTDGKKVRILDDSEENYLMIKLSDNTNGWLNKNCILYNH
ncbi:MAG: hypothetical protein J6B11_04920 [Spirochaetales bacterium]|nr:hypothetical protein [Spirochaetales bacterium]